MRIAISGTHRSGKTTLVEALSDLLPDHETMEEPYRLLEEEGFSFAAPPSLEDFEAQLERSIACLEESGADVVFDRCPADFLAYLLTHDDADAFDLEAWLPRARAALRTLDLVVFVPVETRERIVRSASDDADGRLGVDGQLEQILVDDRFGLDTDVLVVSGDLCARVHQVMARVRIGVG